MYKLVGNGREYQHNNLITLHKDLSNLVCKECAEAATCLTTLLVSGCGSLYTIQCEGVQMSLCDVNEVYEKECEEMYGY
jgi:hypothetical protein